LYIEIVNHREPPIKCLENRIYNTNASWRNERNDDTRYQYSLYRAYKISYRWLTIKRPYK